jgi:hypothetical protein
MDLDTLEDHQIRRLMRRVEASLGQTPKKRAREESLAFLRSHPEELAVIEQDEAEFAATLARAALATEAIRNVARGAKGVSGSIPCPTCGGILRYSVARCNGHIHAFCATDGCVAFMQ